MGIHDLAELIGPGSEARFLDHFERKEPLLLQSDAAAIGELVTREEIGRLLDSRAFAPPRVRLFNAGKPIAREFYLTPDGALDPPALNRVLRAGASLVFDDLGPLLPRLARLERGIERQLRAKVLINAYLTPGKGGAFPAHYDNHEVLIVQVGGSKAWELLGPVEPAAKSRRQYVPRKGQGERDVSWRHTLQAGEILYLPRGQWHRAEVAGDGWSLHLSITIVRESGLDYLQWLAKKLEDDNLFAQDLPRHLGEGALGERERALRDRLAALMAQDGLDAYLAASDRDRGPDETFRLAAGQTPLAADVLVSTLRRPLPSVRPGRAADAGEAALRLLDDAVDGVRFDALLAELREAWPEEIIAAAVARLLDEGLVATA